MKDFIFIIGASGTGKTTLAKNLYKYYKGAYIEQNMIPEFYVPEGEDEGAFCPAPRCALGWTFRRGNL